jgi:hypothetical protein
MKSSSFNLFLVIWSIIGIIYNAYYIMATGYFAPPIGSFSINDTFMDFFNTLYWSVTDGRYTEWRSIYTPINFVILQLLFDDTCKDYIPLGLRDCSTLSILPLLSLLLIANALNAVKFLRSNNSKASSFLLFCAITLSLPNLFALERANLIIISYFFLSLFVFHGCRSTMFLSIVVAFKQYLVLLAFIYILKKDWKKVYSFIFQSLILLVASTVLLWDQNWWYFISNMFDFGASTDFSLFERVWFPNSINSYVRVLESPKLQNLSLGSFSTAGLFSNVAVVIGIIPTIVVIFSALAFGFMDLRSLSEPKLIAFTMLNILILFEPLGGYSYILLIPFLHQYTQNSRLHTFLVAIIFLPIDFSLNFGKTVCGYSWFAESYLCVLTEVTLLSVIRPSALIVLSVSLAVSLSPELLLKAKARWSTMLRSIRV